LATFLLNIGVSVDEVVNLFTRLTDHNLRITRYQVEHLAGMRGSRTKYTPPNCRSLRTHRLCVRSDELCRSVKHPLSYYRKKAGRGR
jgi:DNA primase large subunit